MDLAAYFTPEDLARGALHARGSAVLAWTALLFDLGLLLAFTFGAPGRRIHDACARLAGRVPPGGVTRVLGEAWLAGALFLGTFAIVRAAVGLPFELGRHALARHLGISHDHWLRIVGREGVETFVLALGFAVLGAALGALRSRFPRRWWLAVGTLAGALLFGDAVAEPAWLRLDFTPRPLEAGPLRTRLEGMIREHGAGFHEITVVDASRYGTRANALATGFGPTLQVVVTDTLVAYGDEAVAGAVAHEIGHKRADRLPARLAVAALALVLFLWAVERLVRFALARGARSAAQALPFVLACTSVFLTAAAPFRASFGRAEEREADALELSVRRDHDAFIAEQVRLVRSNALTPRPSGWAALVSDHPSPAERIEAALRARAGAR